MTTDQKLANWICANKSRGELLFRLTQVDSNESRSKAKVVSDHIRESFRETFGIELTLGDEE